MIKNTQDEYHILLVFTHGEIADLKETKKMLIEIEKLPCSVIFVGIGE